MQGAGAPREEKNTDTVTCKEKLYYLLNSHASQRGVAAQFRHASQWCKIHQIVLAGRYGSRGTHAGRHVGGLMTRPEPGCSMAAR